MEGALASIVERELGEASRADYEQVLELAGKLQWYAASVVCKEMERVFGNEQKFVRPHAKENGKNHQSKRFRRQQRRDHDEANVEGVLALALA